MVCGGILLGLLMCRSAHHHHHYFQQDRNIFFCTSNSFSLENKANTFAVLLLCVFDPQGYSVLWQWPINYIGLYPDLKMMWVVKCFEHYMASFHGPGRGTYMPAKLFRVGVLVWPRHDLALHLQVAGEKIGDLRTMRRLHGDFGARFYWAVLCRMRKMDSAATSALRRNVMQMTLRAAHEGRGEES